MAKRRNNISRISSRYRNKLKKVRNNYECHTQAELAARTGIARSIISAIEANRQLLSAPHALLIKEELGCTLDELYELK